MFAGHKIRLNGWQRIGIVASILWVIGGAFWGFNIGYYEDGNVDLDNASCRAQVDSRYTSNLRDFDKGYNAAMQRCWADFSKAKSNATNTGTIYAFLLALLPIPLCWLAVYKSIALLRWIREGFEPQDS